MSSNTAHNMVSSSEVRSSIQKARVSELVKERTVERLKSAEGGAAVETAVDLHNKALRLEKREALTTSAKKILADYEKKHPILKGELARKKRRKKT